MLATYLLLLLGSASSALVSPSLHARRSATATVRRAADAAMFVNVKTKKPGDGTTYPQPGQKCKMHYTGKLQDGTVFDTLPLSWQSSRHAALWRSTTYLMPSCVIATCVAFERSMTFCLTAQGAEGARGGQLTARPGHNPQAADETGPGFDSRQAPQKAYIGSEHGSTGQNVGMRHCVTTPANCTSVSYAAIAS